MTGPSIQSTTGPSTRGPLISEASRVPTMPMISIGIVSRPPSRSRNKKALGASRAVPVPQSNAQFNANIRLMPRDTVDESTSAKRPLVAVGYGPRCVPVMHVAEAAASVCELLWLIDGSLPEMRQMTELLNRFGPVVDIHELGIDQILGELSPPYRPDGIVTYLDANMTTFAEIAEALQLPFHSFTTSAALTDKAVQRRALKDAGLATPACVAISAGSSTADLADVESTVGWP